MRPCRSSKFLFGIENTGRPPASTEKIQPEPIVMSSASPAVFIVCAIYMMAEKAADVILGEATVSAAERRDRLSR